VKELSLRYARMLGLPVVMANKCGPWVSPMPGIPFHVERSSFPGLSAVADSDGTLKAQLGDGEGVIVEDVRLDPSRKIYWCRKATADGPGETHMASCGCCGLPPR